MTAPASAEFGGFRPASLTFLRALARHNDRVWFEANRARYETELRAPLTALIEEVDVRLATVAPEIIGDPRRSPFRIHRDVRFSSDKRPYKTHVAAWFFHVDGGRGTGGADGSTAHGGAGFYLHIEPGRVSLGGGIWMPPPPTLARIRAYLAEHHRSLTRLLASPGVKRFGKMPTESMLTRMPRGFSETHPGAELLRYRSFTLGRTIAERELFSAAFPDTLMGEYTDLVAFVRWFNRAIGLRTLAHR